MHDNVTLLFTTWIVDELQELPGLEREQILKRAAIFERKGWRSAAASDDIKHLRDGIWELRVVGRGPAYRLLFFQAPGDPGRLVVLTTCVGKSRMKKAAVAAAEIDRALTRQAEWLSEHSRRRP